MQEVSNFGFSHIKFGWLVASIQEEGNWQLDTSPKVDRSGFDIQKRE